MVKSNGKARVAPAQIGQYSIDVLLLPGIEQWHDERPRFAVTLPDIAKLFNLDRQKITRTVKTALGQKCRILSYKTEKNPSPLNILMLEDFEALLVELAMRKNPVAIELVRCLASKSLGSQYQPAPPVKNNSQQKRERVGYIYLVTDGEFYKIGFAKNVKKRVATMQTASAKELKVVATKRGKFSEEGRIHRLLKSDRVRSEWFKPSPLMFEIFDITDI